MKEIVGRVRNHKLSFVELVFWTVGGFGYVTTREPSVVGVAVCSVIALVLAWRVFRKDKPVASHAKETR